MSVRLQLIGPLVLFGVVGAGEAMAYALADNPSSALLWYLNAEAFGVLRKSRLLFSADWPFAQMWIVTGLAALAVAGTTLRSNLVVAISSNMSFVFAGFLLINWHHWNHAGQALSASLALVQLPTGNDFWFFTLLLLACSASFATSHLIYIRLLRSQTA